MSVQINRASDEPLKIFGSDLKVWLDANQVNGIGITLPSNNDDVLTWKNLTGLSDYGKTTGRSNRSPKFISKEDGKNNAVLFTRGTSTVAVDTDLLTLENTLPLSFPLTYISVAKPRNLNGGTVNIIGNSGGIGFQGNFYCIDGNGYSLPNTFRATEYRTSKCICICSYETSINRKCKVGDGIVISTTTGSSSSANALHLGGRGYDGDNWTVNFNVFNPRNFDGWIYEIIVVSGDLLNSSNVAKLKEVKSYLKLKYNL